MLRRLEPIKVSNWIEGDLSDAGLSRQHKRNWRRLRKKLARAARRYNRRSRIPFKRRCKFHVVSGPRTYAEQTKLYAAYLAGSGNLAAKPGTSNHELGLAADTYVHGAAVGSVAAAREACTYWGLHFPVQGEAWHIEEVPA